MSVISGPRAHLRVLGCLRLDASDPKSLQLNQRPRLLALLAALAFARSDGISRDRLLTMLWPESDESKARNALNQSVFSVRGALGELAIITEGASLRLNENEVSSDVSLLMAAAADGRDDDLLAVAVGDFIDGVHPVANPEYERWVDDTRNAIRRVVLASLDRSAEHARRKPDDRRLITVLRRRMLFAPYDSTAALDLMQALAAQGDESAALAVVAEHTAIVAKDLECAPSENIVAFERELRRRRGRVSPAAGNATLDHPPRVEAVTSRAVPAGYSRARKTQLLVIAATAITGLGALRFATAHPHAEIPGGELIAMLPFDVRGADKSVSFLGRGLPELLGDEMQGDSRIRVVRSALVERALDSDSATTSQSPDADVRRVGQATGARRVVVGTVMGSPGRLVLRASLIDVAGLSRVAEASVSGPSDSLSQLADQLAGDLLAGQAGFVGPRARMLASVPLPALRQYLDGMTDFRSAQFDQAAGHFRAALSYDSAFALAAMGLASTSVGDAAGASGTLTHALQLAWAARSHLPAPDSAYLRALLGPRYPMRSSTRESFAAWTDAANRAPDRPDVWFGLGDAYFHEGDVLGLPHANASARLAFLRVLEADSTFSPAIEHLIDVAIRMRDSSAVAFWRPRYLALDSIGPMADLVRWHTSASLDVGRSAQSMRALDTMPMLALRWIIEIAPYDGIGMPAAIRALGVRDQRPSPTIGERIETALARHSLALNRGRPHEAAGIRAELAALEPNDFFNLRFVALAALYGEGDSTAAASAVDEMSKHFQIPAASAGHDAAGSLENLEALCVIAQWRLHSGNRQFATEAASALRQAAPKRGLDSEPLFCALLLEQSSSARPRDRVAQLDTLDSLVSSGESLHRAILYAPQAVARLLDAGGRPDRALAAVRRRGFFGRWPYYLATQLSEEARYALAVGDTTGAVCALRHFVALRVDPEPPLRTSVASQVAILGKLSNASVLRPCVR